ncbi:MAG: hypothetical protein JSR46_11530 [Verrucomicrobia bacterium]|nr:hypothetical protein [Verrucomicrobiota bacterium]
MQLQEMIFAPQDPLSSYPGTFMQCPDNALDARQECDYCHNHGYLRKEWVIYARCTRNDQDFIETFGRELYDKYHFVHKACASAWADTNELAFNEYRLRHYTPKVICLPRTREDRVIGGKCVAGGGFALWSATMLVGGGVLATCGAAVAGVTGLVLLGKAIKPIVQDDLAFFLNG